MRQVGLGLMSNYFVAFEVAAVLLLVVMIGAAYMARRRVDDAPEATSDAGGNDSDS